jgi:tetratricopeptide (TPR) repeat protein
VPQNDPAILSSQLSGDALVRVWLPSIGLVGFSESDQLNPTDWLMLPVSTESSPWASPPRAWSPPHGIIELGMLSAPTSDAVLSEMRREIGLPSNSLLNTGTDGSSGAASSPAGKLKRWLLKKLDAVARRSKRDGDASEQGVKGKPGPSGAGKNAGTGTGLVGKGAGLVGTGLGVALGTIVAPLAAVMSTMMQGERERQIQKLLRMFESNPDAALKYAIPIGGIADAFRGFAMPGAALLARLTDFSLGGIGGGAGGPADLWSIDYRLQNRLQERYRAQANREMAAGRYRRAAYIFAQLLSDFRGAAEALEKGRFYGEAAVLYRDHVHDQQNAARCFAKARMYREASELYVAMNLYESAGEVLFEAGCEEEAREMFREAFRAQLRKGAVIAAANILDQRLGQRTAAIELLCAQWPDGDEVLQATGLAIEWLGQDGLHDETLSLLDQMSDAACEKNCADLAHLTQQATRKYPDHRVRTAAEDHCRLAVSRSLRSESRSEHRTVLSSLGGLDPSDTQLHRDTLDYNRGFKKKRPAPSVMRREWWQLPDLRLPPNSHYIDFRVEQSQLFALTMRDDRMFLTHLPTPEASSSVNTTRSVKLSSGNMALTRPDAFIKRIHFQMPASVHVVAHAPEDSAHFLNANRLTAKPAPMLRIVSDASLLTSVDPSPNNIWQVRRLNRNLVLSHGNGQTFDLTQAWAESWENLGYAVSGDACGSAALAAVNGEPIVALDHVLLMLRRGQIERLATFDEPVWSLAGSLPKTRARIAVAHRSGLEVVDLREFETTNVCRQRGYSLCIWAPGGRLVAWSDDKLHCFESRGEIFTRVAETKSVGLTMQPTCLLPLSPSVIGVAFADGRISRYRLPQ